MPKHPFILQSQDSNPLVVPDERVASALAGMAFEALENLAGPGLAKRP